MFIAFNNTQNLIPRFSLFLLFNMVATVIIELVILPKKREKERGNMEFSSHVPVQNFNPNCHKDGFFSFIEKKVAFT
jgi:hypothetical protein